MINKLICIFLGLISFVPEKQNLPNSGYYENLALSINNNFIEGYFYSNTGNSQISCFYKFNGIIKNKFDKSVTITATYPENDEEFTGELFFIDSKTFRIKFNEPLLGDMACDGVSSEEGNTFNLIEKVIINDLLICKNDKNYFYKTPKKSDKKKSYITLNPQRKV